jgi:hypothetical protein
MSQLLKGLSYVLGDLFFGRLVGIPHHVVFPGNLVQVDKWSSREEMKVIYLVGEQVFHKGFLRRHVGLVH